MTTSDSEQIYEAVRDSLRQCRPRGAEQLMLRAERHCSRSRRPADSMRKTRPTPFRPMP